MKNRRRIERAIDAVQTAVTMAVVIAAGVELFIVFARITGRL